MNETQEQKLVEVARTWINTPYAKQGKYKHVGVDCAAVISQSVEEAGILPEISGLESESEKLKLILDRAGYVRPLDGAAVGDVVAFKEHAGKRLPKHIGLVTRINERGDIYIVEAGRQRVAEHRVDGFGMSCLHSIWRIGATEEESAEAVMRRAEVMIALKAGVLADPFSATILGVKLGTLLLSAAVSTAASIGAGALSSELPQRARIKCP